MRSTMLASIPSLVLPLLLFLLPQLVTATCYWQNSTLAPDDPYSIAPDDTACFPDQDNSPCCGTGWTCLSDGVCYINIDNGDYYYRGTCTDRTWNSQQCPGWCFSQNANTSIPLAKCNTAQDWYCCPGDSSCSCNTGKNAVKLGDNQPSTITVIGSTSWPGITSTTTPFTQSSPLVSDGTSTSESAGKTTTKASSATSSPSSTTTTTTTSGTGTADGASQTSTPPVVSSSNSNTGLAAGLGAGLGAAAVLIGVLIFYVFRNRRRHRRNNTANTLVSEAKDPNYYDLTNQNRTDSTAQYKGFYGSPNSRQPIGPVEAPPSTIQPELAGAGEYDRSEMPTERYGDDVHGRSRSRAELPS